MKTINPRISYPFSPRVHPVVKRWAEKPLFEKTEESDLYARAKELLKAARKKSRVSQR